MTSSQTTAAAAGAVPAARPAPDIRPGVALPGNPFPLGATPGEHLGLAGTNFQPFLVIIDPIVSIALSVWLFEEHFTSDAAVLAVAAAAFAVMCAGVVLLTQTAPATMKADIGDDNGAR